MPLVVGRIWRFWDQHLHWGDCLRHTTFLLVCRVGRRQAFAFATLCRGPSGVSILFLEGVHGIFGEDRLWSQRFIPFLRW